MLDKCSSLAGQFSFSLFLCPCLLYFLNDFRVFSIWEWFPADAEEHCFEWAVLSLLWSLIISVFSVLRLQSILLHESLQCEYCMRSYGVQGIGLRSWELISSCKKWTESFWSVPEWLEQALKRWEPSNHCGFHSTVPSCVPNQLKSAFLTIFSSWVIYTTLTFLCLSSPIQNTVIPSKQTWLYASCHWLKEIWLLFLCGY